MKSKWIKFAPGQLPDRFLGSSVPGQRTDRTLFQGKHDRKDWMDRTGGQIGQLLYIEMISQKVQFWFLLTC